MDKVLKEFFGAAKNVSLEQSEKQSILKNLVRVGAVECHKNTMESSETILGNARSATLHAEEKAVAYEKINTFVNERPVREPTTPLWGRILKLPQFYVPAIAVLVVAVFAKEQLPFSTRRNMESETLRQEMQEDHALQVLPRGGGIETDVPVPALMEEAPAQPEPPLMQALPPSQDTTEKQDPLYEESLEMQAPSRALSDDAVSVSSTFVHTVSNSQKKTVVNGITVEDTESFEESVMVSLSGPPQISSLLPKNEATDVAPDSRFSITFSENVTLDQGDIVIHRFGDESIVATLHIPSSQVTQAGFQGVSFRLANPLPPNEHFFITLTPGSVIDTDEEPFGGIKEKSVWHFTTTP